MQPESLSRAFGKLRQFGVRGSGQTRVVLDDCPACATSASPNPSSNTLPETAAMPCCPIGCAVPRPACTRSQGGRIQHTTWTGQSLDPAFVAPLPLFQRLEISVLADLLSGTSVARMPARTSLFAAGDKADCFY